MPHAPGSLRREIRLRAEAIKGALELQAADYMRQLDALRADLSETKEKIASLLRTISSVSFAASVLVALAGFAMSALGLLIAALGLWLAFRR